MADDVKAASSTATDAGTTTPAANPIAAAVETGDFSNFRDAKRAAEKSGAGDLPIVADKPAGTAPAKPVAQAAAPDASTATPAPAAEPVTNPKTAARIDKLLADRAAADARAERAERELADSRRAALPRTDKPTDVQPAASSTAAAPTLEDAIRRPDISKPPMDETAFFTAHPGASWAAYTQHVTNHAIAVSRAESQQLDRRARAEQADVERANGFSSKLKAARDADPTFVEKVSLEVFGLKPVAVALELGERIGVDNAIAEEIINSDVPDALMLHLSEHPDELAKLRGAKNSRHLNRLFGELEAGLRKPAAAAIPPKHVTDAPAPPTTLGSRPATAADPIRSAVVSGDFSAFRAAKRAGLANQR